MKLRDVSLKWKLIFASTIVQAAMAALLALNSARLIENSLIEQADLRHKELTALLNASLGGPLVEGDYGTILDLLDHSRNPDGIVYMVLYDRSNTVIARSGHGGGPLPAVNTSMLDDKDGDGIYDTQVPIDVNGHVYGVLRYGISMRFLEQSRAHLVEQSVLIGGIALLVSVVLLAAIAFLLTRNLGALIRVSRQVASGNLWAVVPVTAKDEVGVLSETFNKMTLALRERIHELSKSEADFHAIADYTYSWENWHSPEGKLIWVNSSVERVTGYTPQECLAMEDFPLPIIYSEDADTARRELARSLRGGSGNDLELRIVRKNGELVWCSVSWQSIYNVEHAYLGVRSSIRDISERKIMDALIQEKIEELQHSEEIQRDLVEQADASQMVLPLILGRDVVGGALLGDLAKMPHLLVAGATGTGKSVCMNAMICSILLFRGPDEVKFIMVDPKMVELAGYEDIPHLLTPPITDMTKAHAALEWACRTMDERYFALRLVGVRDIKAYNELGEPEIRNRLARKGKTLEDLPGLEVRMPYIVILVDEYADLMMVNKEVEKSLIRLAAKSRAAGLHLILTTQRPSADVVTGLIKSNLPARICFRVADKSNSRVVLDAGGAENLIGKGDMLYLPPGTSALVRGQGVWVKDKEIEAIIEHAKSQGAPQYDESITAGGAVAMAGGGTSGDAKSSEWIGDRQFHEAVQAMYRYNRTGADFFRRKLNIGYNKATSYVEQLEDLGFVGPQKGTAAREIVKSWDDWIELLKQSGVTWDEEDEAYRNPLQMGAGEG